MKKLLLLALVAFISVCAFAQSWDTISSANASCLIGTCSYVDLAQTDGYAVIQVTGTFSGTLQFEASADKVTFVSLAGTPSVGGSSVTSTTAAGTWQANVAGYKMVRVRGSAMTSGAATVKISKGQAPSISSSSFPGVRSYGANGLQVDGALAVGTTVSVGGSCPDGTPAGTVCAKQVAVGTSKFDASLGLITVPSTPTTAGIVTRGLVALYLFDEHQGTTVFDRSGNGHHAAIVGTPSWQATGINFPSTSQYVTIPDAAWSQMKSAAWVASLSGSGTQFFLCAQAAGKKCIATYVGSTKLWRVYATGGDYSDSAVGIGTNLVTYVSNATTDTFYNGSMEATYESGKHGTTSAIANGTGARLGYYSSTGFAGTVSFLALYSVELTPTEVAQNAAAVKKLMANRTAGILIASTGDSLTYGADASAGMDYVTQLSNSLTNTGSSYTLYNGGHSGYTTDQLLTTVKTEGDAQYSILQKRSIAIFWAGTNDWFNVGTSTAAQIVANMNQFCTDRKAVGFDYCFVATVIARASTDTGAPPQSVNRLTLNSAITAGCTGACDGVIDFASDPAFAAASASTNTQVYYSDQTHLIDFGYGVIAQIVKQKLLPLGVF